MLENGRPMSAEVVRAGDCGLCDAIGRRGDWALSDGIAEWNCLECGTGWDPIQPPAA